MQKTSKIINLLTILVGLGVAVVAYLLIDAADQFRAKSSDKRTELDAARQALAETEKNTEREEASLRARKNDMTDDLEKHRDELAKLKLSLPEKEIELTARQKQQEDVRRNAVQKRAEATELEAAIKTANDTVSRLSTGNPGTRATLNRLQDDLDEQHALFAELEIEWRDYKAETEHLRSHYVSILEALRVDAENPSWITIGKSVLTKIERLSMETGMLVLPLGSTHGMRNNMRFFVSKNGKRVGQIIIKETGLGHSVANIVPLIGNPTKLREKDSVEITGF